MFVHNARGVSLPQRTIAAATPFISLLVSVDGLDNARRPVVFKPAHVFCTPNPDLGHDFHRSGFFDRAAR
jgi:hypothetical protein